MSDLDNIVLSFFGNYRDDQNFQRDSQKLTMKEIDRMRKEFSDMLKSQNLYSQKAMETLVRIAEELKNIKRFGGTISDDMSKQAFAGGVSGLFAGGNLSPSGSSELHKELKDSLAANAQAMVSLREVIVTLGDKISAQFKETKDSDPSEAAHRERGRKLGKAITQLAGAKGSKEIVSGMMNVGKKLMSFLSGLPFLSKLGGAIADAVGKVTSGVLGDSAKLLILMALNKIRDWVGPLTAGVQAARLLLVKFAQWGTTIRNAIGNIGKSVGGFLAPALENVKNSILKTKPGKFIADSFEKVAKSPAGRVLGKIGGGLGKAGKLIGKGAGPLALLAAGATYHDNLKHGDSKAKALTKTILSHAAGMATYAGITGSAAAATGGAGGLAVQGGAIAASAGVQAATNKGVDALWDFFEGKRKKKEEEASESSTKEEGFGSKILKGAVGADKFGFRALNPVTGTGFLTKQLLDHFSEQGEKEDKRANILEKFFEWIKDMWPWGHDKKEAREAEKQDKLGGKAGAIVTPTDGSDKQLYKNLTTDAKGLGEGSGFDGHKITSMFGERIHPVYGTKKFHKGIDLAYKPNEAVGAKIGGKITKMEYQKGYGNVVYMVDPKTGVEQRYAHLNGFAAGLKVGDTVKAGDIIGAAGNTGVGTGVHVHYETRKKGVAVDPIKTTVEARRELGITKDTVRDRQIGEISTDEKIKQGIYSSSAAEKPKTPPSTVDDYAGNESFCSYVGTNGISNKMSMMQNYNCSNDG